MLRGCNTLSRPVILTPDLFNPKSYPHHCVGDPSQKNKQTDRAYCYIMTACQGPYLTLPYHTGKTFYRPVLRPLTGPVCIPELTVRLQNPPSAVLTWVHTNTWNHPPPKRGPTHLNLLTIMYSWYLQENISSKAHKHIHPGHHDQQDSKPGNQSAFSKHTLYNISITL